jgi:hypothetical protein
MHGTRFRAQGKAKAPSESLHVASSVRVTSSESQWAAPGTADCSYDPSRATRTTSPPTQIIGCKLRSGQCLQVTRDESTRGPFSKAQQEGRAEFYYRSIHPPHRCQESDPDTVAAPTAQRQKVCEYRAKVPIHSRRRWRRPEGQVPAWHKGPILVGKICSIGRDRAPRRPWPAVTRSASRRSSESHPPVSS